MRRLAANPVTHPGRLNMPLHHWLVGTVGFIASGSERIGTCFLVRVRSETLPDRDHGYIVTARHNLYQEDRSGADAPDRPRADLAIHMPYEGLLEPVIIPAPHGEWTEGEEDVAAFPWFDQDDERPFNAIPLYSHASHNAGIMPLIGNEAFYAGLLGDSAFQAMRKPMVMSASVGAHYVKGVRYDEQNSYTVKYAHLLDCRSREGFSGSPVFVQGAYPGSRTYPLPELWQQEHPDAGSLGGMHYFAVLWGMLVGWARYAGVAIVLPVEVVEQLLMKEELVAKRKRLDDEKKAERKKDGLGAEPMRRDPFGREEFMDDLRKATKPYPPEQSDQEA